MSLILGDECHDRPGDLSGRIILCLEGSVLEGADVAVYSSWNGPSYIAVAQEKIDGRHDSNDGQSPDTKDENQQG
jgi:hypothetical protein